jgi:biopolymer transport protein ExbD
MAYEPSKRKKSEYPEMELDIRPVMNLMVVLIPLLLSCAQFVKLGVIEINVPPAKTDVGPGPDDDQMNNEAQEKQLKLGLKIAVTRDGITLGNAMTLIAGEAGAGPTVPNNADGTYDFKKMREKLIEVKKLIAGKGYTDENRAVITASPDIEYQTIVSIMDNVQTYENDSKEILALFPEVNFGSIIQ